MQFNDSSDISSNHKLVPAVNSIALEALVLCFDDLSRCTFDMQPVINLCGTGRGLHWGDGSMIEVAYSVVTMPSTQCQKHTPNKLTRDKKL